jgi:O-antigen/teichoic acid export membrane protein/Ser/Thr protein kinase RdoA (MazF antagonist)
MNKMINAALGQWRRARELFRTDSLFRNAVYLMSSTAIMSVLGFVFWIFVAHLYAPAQIGAASALISITLLISNLSFLGLNSGFLRFLPSSQKQSRDINAGLITVAGVTILAAAVYLLLGNGFVGALGFFTAHLWTKALFMLLMVAVSLNTLTDSVFIANRRAGFHTVVYTTFGTLKLALPLLLISLGSLGIFAAYVAAALVSLVLSLVFMWRGTGYRLLAAPNWHFIRSVRRYTTNNYVSTIMAGLPSQVLPSLIVGALGSAQAAYFSMAWTMANVLYVIPSALTNSLMAESSHDLSRHARNLKHAARTLTLILVPAVLAAVVVAPFLLRLFGDQYAAGSTAIFQLLALSALSIAFNSIGSAVMNLEHRTEGVVILQAVISATTLGLAWLLIHSGLVGVGLAMLGGNLAGNLVSFYYMATSKHLKRAAENSRPLTPAVVSRLLSQYKLDGATFESIDPGTAGSTVTVCHRGQKYVLKIYQGSDQTADHLGRELKFTNFLTARDMPVPRTIDTAKGHSYAHARANGCNWYSVLMHFEQGRHPETYSRRLLRDMARVQAGIHVAGAAYAGDNTADAKLLTGHTLKSRLLKFAPKGLGHFDFDGTNLLAKNGWVSCVLDFEGVRYDPLVVCVIFTLSRLYSYQRNSSELGEYLDSYQTVRPLNFVEKLAIRAALTLRFKTPRLLILKF